MTDIIQAVNDNQNTPSSISRQQVEAAVKTLLAWAGDNPARAGVRDTPKRVVDAYHELFGGYKEDGLSQLREFLEPSPPHAALVVLKAIPFASHCEHHMLPIIGVVHIGYIPKLWVAGLSKLARLVDVYARRLQIQEKLNSQIFSDIMQGLDPMGAAVVIVAKHHCMTTRGVHKKDTSMTTARYGGVLAEDEFLRREFLAQIA